MRESEYKANISIFKLHPFKCTHWVLNKNDYYLDSFVCPSPKKLATHIKKNKRKIGFFQYKKLKKTVFRITFLPQMPTTVPLTVSVLFT